MGLIEALTAVMLATYALVSGAFLSAAITAPRNCSLVLDIAFKPGLHETISQCVLWGGLTLFVSLSWLDILPKDGPRVFVWLAAAHVSTLVMLYLSRSIARFLIDRERE